MPTSASTFHEQTANEHKRRLQAFQEGEERFVWGRLQGTGDLWFLDEDAARDRRTYVKNHVVCPVPGCAAPLTTVHFSAKRDHLRHLVSSGGHARESLLHSQGCALIEDWLRRSHPRSTVQREEYTSPTGERRADVLLTGPKGDRVAFEVQYSPLTPEQWRNRHDSYRSQGIVDVWLFGHTGKQLRLDAEGMLKPNPTHLAVVAEGAALLFINPDPDRHEIAVAVGEDFQFNAESEALGPLRPTLSHLHEARLEIHTLDSFRADPQHGMTSTRLHQLYEQSKWLQQHNVRERARVGELRERKRLAREARQRTWEARRSPQQARIRDLLSTADRWSRSDALATIKDYFGDHLRDRIKRVYAAQAPDGLSLIHWQCVIYFDLIAGQSAEFGVPAAVHAIDRRGLRMNESTKWRDVARYLHTLADAGFLNQPPGQGRFPTFVPTVTGAWW